MIEPVGRGFGERNAASFGLKSGGVVEGDGTLSITATETVYANSQLHGCAEDVAVPETRELRGEDGNARIEGEESSDGSLAHWLFDAIARGADALGRSLQSNPAKKTSQ